MQEKIQYSQPDIKKNMREFITENFLAMAGLSAFEDSDSFMESGMIDSTGILVMMEYVENTFKIKIEDEEVVPENLDSLSNLTSFIEGKIGS